MFTVLSAGSTRLSEITQKSANVISKENIAYDNLLGSRQREGIMHLFEPFN